MQHTSSTRTVGIITLWLWKLLTNLQNRSNQQWLEWSAWVGWQFVKQNKSQLNALVSPNHTNPTQTKFDQLTLTITHHAWHEHTHIHHVILTFVIHESLLASQLLSLCVLYFLYKRYFAVVGVECIAGPFNRPQGISGVYSRPI